MKIGLSNSFIVLTCILYFSNTGIMSRIEAPFVVKSSSVLFINCRMLSLVSLFCFSAVVTHQSVFVVISDGVDPTHLFFILVHLYGFLEGFMMWV